MNMILYLDSLIYLIFTQKNFFPKISFNFSEISSFLKGFNRKPLAPAFVADTSGFLLKTFKKEDISEKTLIENHLHQLLLLTQFYL